MANAENNGNNGNNNNQNRDIEQARLAMDAVGGVANFAMNLRQQGRDARRQEEERQRAEEQRQQEIVERAENQLTTKILEIYENSKLLVRTHSLRDTEFSIDVVLFEGIIESVKTEQEERYDSLKEEVEKWWTPCARSKAKRINDNLKDNAEASIEYLKQCLTKLNEFASQDTGHCNYTPLKEAIENYNLSNSGYTWAKAIGLKAISSNQLADGSVKRAQFIIDHSDKVLMQFKEIIDAARDAYEKKAVKAIYDSQVQNLNLLQFYLDKIVDLKKQGTKIYEAEMLTYAQRLERGITEYVGEQKVVDIGSMQDNIQLYKDILDSLNSPEDLNLADIQNILDGIRLPNTTRVGMEREWISLREEHQNNLNNDLANLPNQILSDNSETDYVLRTRVDEIELRERLDLESSSTQFSENNGEGASVLDNNTTATNERLTEDNISLYMGILASITSLEDLNSADIQNTLDSIEIPNTTRDSMTREWLLSRQYEGNDEHNNLLNQFLPSRSENINSDHGIEEVTLGGITIIDSDSTIG